MEFKRYSYDGYFRTINNYHVIETVKSPKAIVWAHNTHIGDARFTDMASSGDDKYWAIVREKKGIQNTVLIGFRTL